LRLKLQKNTLPLQRHLYGISRLKLCTLKLLIWKIIQMLIFWSLCDLFNSKTFKKMLLQMTNGFLQLESTMCFKNAFTSRYCTVGCKKNGKWKLSQCTLYLKKNSVGIRNVSPCNVSFVSIVTLNKQEGSMLPRNSL
jgi:hypothetical protein